MTEIALMPYEAMIREEDRIAMERIELNRYPFWVNQPKQWGGCDAFNRDDLYKVLRDIHAGVGNPDALGMRHGGKPRVQKIVQRLRLSLRGIRYNRKTKSWELHKWDVERIDQLIENYKDYGET